MRKRKICYYVYIVQAADGTYYTGMTKNIEERLALHARGRGARYLRGRTPITLVYSEPCPDIRSAMVREIQVKRYSKKRKQKLIENPPVIKRKK